MGVGLEYRILPFKGLYYKLSSLSPVQVRGNIYPVPDLRVPFLGVHFTRSAGGDVYIGPTAIPAMGREQYRGLKGLHLGDGFMILKEMTTQLIKNKNGFRELLQQEMPKLSRRGFFKAAKALTPSLKEEHLLSCDKVGIRAQLYNRNTAELEMDFVVKKGEHSTHILNAVSPAFTCSRTFSRYVVDEFAI